jgi:hypothetical protein
MMHSNPFPNCEPLQIVSHFFDYPSDLMAENRRRNLVTMDFLKIRSTDAACSHFYEELTRF